MAIQSASCPHKSELSNIVRANELPRWALQTAQQQHPLSLDSQIGYRKTSQKGALCKIWWHLLVRLQIEPSQDPTPPTLLFPRVRELTLAISFHVVIFYCIK